MVATEKSRCQSLFNALNDGRRQAPKGVCRRLDVIVLINKKGTEFLMLCALGSASRGEKGCLLEWQVPVLHAGEEIVEVFVFGSLAACHLVSKEGCIVAVFNQTGIRHKTTQNQPFICSVQKNTLSLHCKNGRIMRLFLQ